MRLIGRPRGLGSLVDMSRSESTLLNDGLDRIENFAVLTESREALKSAGR